MRRIWIIGIWIVMAAGCKSEREIAQELIDTNRGMAEEKLAGFEKVGRAAKEKYVISSEYGKIQPESLKLDFTDEDGSNATWALVDDLVDLSKRAEPQIRFQSEDWDLTLTIADFLKKRGRSMSGDLRLNEYCVTNAFKRLQRVKYLLVVRVKDYWPATDNFGDTFSPGRAAGDALLYEIAGAKFLGALAFKATNSDVAVLSESESSEELKKDLGSNMADAIQAQLKEHIPGTKPQEVTGF